jgi:hypothetical protein
VRRLECEKREKRHCKGTRHIRDLDNALKVVFAFVESTAFSGSDEAKLECPFVKGMEMS